MSDSVVPALAAIVAAIPPDPWADLAHMPMLCNAPDTKRRTGPFARMEKFLAENGRRSLTPDQCTDRIASLWDLPLPSRVPEGLR